MEILSCNQAERSYDPKILTLVSDDRGSVMSKHDLGDHWHAEWHAASVVRGSTTMPATPDMKRQRGKRCIQAGKKPALACGPVGKSGFSGRLAYRGAQPIASCALVFLSLINEPKTSSCVVIVFRAMWYWNTDG